MEKYLLQSQKFITNWAAFLYYKVGQIVLQSGAAGYQIFQQLAIYKYFSYYKVGQVLLQSGAGITNWGIITKWCITILLSYN